MSNKIDFQNKLKKKSNKSLLAKLLFQQVFKSSSIMKSFKEWYQFHSSLNSKFTDSIFPPNEESLICGVNNKNVNSKKWKKIAWVRASDLGKDYTIFPEKMMPREIKQGALNNCSFLSVVAAIAENSTRIRSMFLTDTVNPYGIYGVKLCKEGELTEVLVDDYIPVDKVLNKECFSTGCPNTLWVQLIEKAYAKIYGSYLSSESKDLERIMHDITCAPIVSLDNSSPELYSELIKADKKNWLIVASAGETEASQELLKEIGLVHTHAYTILQVISLNDNSSKSNCTSVSSEHENEHEHDDKNLNTLLKIRNHWLKDGWLGDWSEGSPAWNEEALIIVDYDNDQSCFYMNWKDFKHYFSKIKICKIYPTYNYVYLRLLQKVDSYCLVKVTIKEQVNKEEWTHGFITLMQKRNEKAFPDGKYGILRMIICKLIGDPAETDEYVEYMTGKMVQEQETFEEGDFEPGEYWIFTELDKNLVDTHTVISVYSNGTVFLEELKRETYPRILEKIYISCAKKQNIVFYFTKDGAPNCAKYSNTSIEGYTYIYIENNEEDTTLIEHVNYTKFEGLKWWEPFNDTSYKVNVGPKERQIVLIKQWELTNYNLIFSHYSSFKFGRETLKRLTLEKGKKKARKDPKLNIDLDIFVHTFKYSWGLCYYYQNKTSDRRLEETLSLTNVIGVSIVGETPDANHVLIEWKPKEDRFVEWKATKLNWSVQSKVSYKIENL